MGDTFLETCNPGLNEIKSKVFIPKPFRGNWSCSLVAYGGLSEAHRHSMHLRVLFLQAFRVKKTQLTVSRGKPHVKFLPLKGILKPQGASECLLRAKMSLAVSLC